MVPSGLAHGVPRLRFERFGGPRLEDASRSRGLLHSCLVPAPPSLVMERGALSRLEPVLRALGSNRMERVSADAWFQTPSQADCAWLRGESTRISKNGARFFL